MLIQINEWLSPNGKYRILAKGYNDKTSIVSVFKVDEFGKNRAVLRKELPKYVLEQVEVMTKAIEAYV